MVKIACCIYTFFILCLISLPGPCTAEDLTPSSSFEASLPVSTSNEPNPPAGAIDPFQPSIPAGPLTDLDSTEAALSSEQKDGFVQAPVEDVAPESSSPEEAEVTIADPLEPVNRAFFHFNDKLYFWVFKPVATGYKTIVPEDGRIGVHNFFSNLTTPVRLVNCLLQAKFKGAGNEAARFLINSTFGLLGVLDPAKKELKIDKQEADFGQTLGIWGMGPIFYLVWPVLGPSTVRETAGYVGDAFLDFRTYLPSKFLIVNMSAWVLDKVNETSLNLGEYENMKKAALDPYVAFREAYFQYRQNKVKK